MSHAAAEPTFVGTVAVLTQNSISVPFLWHLGCYYSCFVVFGVHGLWFSILSGSDRVEAMGLGSEPALSWTCSHGSSRVAHALLNM